jgi:hypothetical protein
MRSDNWFRKFWTRLGAGVVQDVPPALEECETCREVGCTQERWLKCERRLGTEATSFAITGVVASEGRSDELPALYISQKPQAAPEAQHEAGVAPREKKISSN